MKVLNLDDVSIFDTKRLPKYNEWSSNIFLSMPHCVVGVVVNDIIILNFFVIDLIFYIQTVLT